MYTRLQGTMVGSARARGAITLYVLMCCEVLVKCSFLGGGEGLYSVFLIVYPPRGAWRTARVLEVRNDHRAPAPRGGDHSVSEVARWSHVLRNLARGKPAGPQTCGPRSPVWPVTGVARRASDPRPPHVHVRSSLSVVSPNTRISIIITASIHRHTH